MSRLTNKFSLMKNMNEDELREYIKTLTDNDKNILIFSFMKLFWDNQDILKVVDRIEE